MTGTLAIGQFYGQVRGRLDIAGVTLAETGYGRGFQVPDHEHAHPFFCYVLDGSVAETTDGVPPRLLGARTAFYHPAGLRHAEAFGGGAARLFSVQLGPAWQRRLRALDLTLPDRHIGAATGRLPSIAAALYREFQASDSAAGLAVEGLVLTAVAELVRARTPPVRGRRPPWLDRLIDRLHAEHADPPSLAVLAAEASVHPMHLTRVVRRHLGCSIGELVRRIRIDDACRRIALGEPLARVAAATGFADQSHFSKTFARIVGVSPGRYRRRLLG